MLSGWRPPSTWLRGVPLLWLIQACWEQDEGRRPPFRQIVKLLGGDGSSSGSGSGGSGRCLSPDGDNAAAGGDLLPGFGARSPLFGPAAWPSSERGSPIASLDCAGGGGGEGGAGISAELAFSGTSAEHPTATVSMQAVDLLPGLPSGSCPYVRGSYGGGANSSGSGTGLFGAQGSGSSVGESSHSNPGPSPSPSPSPSLIRTLTRALPLTLTRRVEPLERRLRGGR